MNINTIVQEKRCTGCLTCMEECPVDAIVTHIGKEGYIEPNIDNEKCIKCGKCEMVCPISKKEGKINIGRKAYVFQNSDLTIRKQSTSGGVFSAVADLIIQKNGIVYGAAYDSEWNVRHIGVLLREDLRKLRGSKYVQSNLNGIYAEVKKNLEKDIQVCFSGTPCQLAGLKSYLKKEYDNLLLIDVVCRGVGAPELWKRYIEEIKGSFTKGIDYIGFRDKINGYAASAMVIESCGKKYFRGKTIESFKMLFFRGYNLRNSCYFCEFKGRERYSDLTIFDCWHVNQYVKEWDDDNGTSAVIVNSKKGELIIDSMKGMHKVQEVDIHNIISTDGDMISTCAIKPTDIETYWEDFAEGYSPNELCDKYCPYNAVKYMKSVFKVILAKLHILSFFTR